MNKQSVQLEQLQKESKAKDEYIKELELMLQEGKYLDMLTPDANEISMNEQSKDELASKIKENKSLIVELENGKKKIEELTKKNKDLELLVTQQDAKLSSYIAKENTETKSLDQSTESIQNRISPEVESLLEDQQHSLELLEEENKQLRKALNQTEMKLKKLELVQYEDIEKLVHKVCDDTTSPTDITPTSATNKKPPVNLTLTNGVSASTTEVTSPTKNEFTQNPTSPTKRHNSSTPYSNAGAASNGKTHSNESINKDKENYYTMIIQELQDSLEEEKKKHQEEMKMVLYLFHPLINIIDQ